ncbi:MAG: HAMP domain-containing sensor histidine kinase [Myxococcota bacterium]
MPSEPRSSPTDLERASVRAVVALGVTLALVLGVTGAAALQGTAAPSGELLPLTRFFVSLGITAVASTLVAVLAVGISARDFTSDLRFVSQGLAAMNRDEGLAESIPLRTLDELGELVRSFHELRLDFVVALERERALRRQAEEAEAARAELLRAVSHEVRTPLNAVLGFADVLLEEIDGPLNDAQREDLRILKDAGAHLLSLFEDVVDLSEATSSVLSLRRADVDLGPLIENVVAELRGQQRQRGAVTLRTELAEDLPPVHGDRKRLRQLVTNLAGNALRFTDAGEVVVRAAVEDDAVIVEVRDTGIGIAPEDRELIFQEFGQASPGGRRRGGAGLGLAIVQRLTELHRGTIEVTSEVGVGSAFTVRLPLARSTEPPPEPPA